MAPPAARRRARETKNPGVCRGSLSEPLACSALASGLFGQHAHVQALLGAFLLEAHLSSHLGEQCVVSPDPNVRAGTHLRAALAHDDVAGQHLLATEALHTEPLGVRVTAVLGTAACLFMCHELPLPEECCPAAQPALMSVTLTSVNICRWFFCRR